MISKRGFIRPLAIAGTVLTLAVLALAGIFYTMFLPGLSVARIEPSTFEKNIATWLLTNSIPEE
ncbi:MAG: hypothetical protein ACKVG0_07160, partial [Alphaproteobacteria bacterium]